MLRRFCALIMLSGVLGWGAWAHSVPTADDRIAFQDAVTAYQMFVVPHCAPEDVRAYVTARHGRDEAFVRSLRGTILARDYKAAIARSAAESSRTFYDCIQPPPPPPPPGAAPAPLPTAAEIEAAHREALGSFFDEGDQQFHAMVQLRDRMIGSRQRGR